MGAETANSCETTGGLLELDQQMCFALYSTSLAMTKLYKPLLSELDLTYPQYLVLMVLWENDGVSVSGLKDRLFLDYGTLTPLVKRLEAQGLLSRRRSPEDERQVLVHLTEQGRALREKASKVPPQIASASGCTFAELDELKNQLNGLRQRLHHHLNSGKA